MRHVKTPQKSSSKRQKCINFKLNRKVSQFRKKGATISVENMRREKKKMKNGEIQQDASGNFDQET
jgi:hypothetical protein